jgi:serine/threonine-protein kinase
MSDPNHIENFEIVSLLGQGGMATVWKARQASLDRFVAIKVLARNFSTDPAEVVRFRDEARAAGHLKHSGIVQVYDANIRDGNYYFVMELVDGYTVGEWIRRKAHIPVSDALTVAESVVSALDYAWSNFGIIHCDIKPENIMIDADGTVKITDLGLSRAISNIQSTEPEAEVLGTPAYMAPEQVTGQPDLDCRADIYALGATLYHMVVGHTIFTGATSDEEIMRKHLIATVPNPLGEIPGLSHKFVMLITRMLAKDRKYRQADWKEVLADIRRIRSGQPPEGAMPPPGASTIFWNADELDTVQRMARNQGAYDDEPVNGLGFMRLVLIALIIASAGVSSWYLVNYVNGGNRPASAIAPRHGGAADALARLQDARDFVAAHPDDLTGGIARFDMVMAMAPGSENAVEAQCVREYLQAKLDTEIASTKVALDEQVNQFIAQHRVLDAVALLENYEGRYAVEIAIWRSQRAQQIRAMLPPAQPAPAPVKAPLPSDPAPAKPSPAATTTSPTPALAASHLSPEEAVQRMSSMLFKEGLFPAFGCGRRLEKDHAELGNDPAYTAMRNLLQEAVSAQAAIAESFATEKDKVITVRLSSGVEQGTVTDVKQRRMIVMKTTKGDEKTFSVDDLDVAERFKRLGVWANANAPGSILLKGMWAFHSHAYDRANDLFATLPAPAGPAILRAAKRAEQ